MDMLYHEIREKPFEIFIFSGTQVDAAPIMWFVIPVGIKMTSLEMVLEFMLRCYTQVDGNNQKKNKC
jgi:hypothetical protein